ncbi:hypothetical protein [Cytobacillus oceanisediminis]|uniref:hypothetical protein n=2 Tax=Bacillaceae TaxID=186817 RepID=UPI001FB51296|nr:hypothetical protein [Cytobacillus oceanisediminis]UOE57536.1 hypothetical protein IRB79_12665 [Cytobacillus oceanisediminis]
MVLPAALVIAFYTLSFFFFIEKKLSFMQNSLVLMLISIAARNYTTILALQLKWIHITEDSILFIVFLIHREIIGPFLVLMFINIYWKTQSGVKRINVFAIFLICLLGMDLFSLTSGVITFLDWNLIKAGIGNSAFLIAGLGLSRWIMYLKQEPTNYGKGI